MKKLRLVGVVLSTIGFRDNTDDDNFSEKLYQIEKKYNHSLRLAQGDNAAIIILLESKVSELNTLANQYNFDI